MKDAGEKAGHVPMEEMDVFQFFEGVADWCWDTCSNWPRFAQDTIGKQLVRSADSVNANLVEGDGRYTDPDAVKFFIIARGSARETRLWIRRAAKRNLVSQQDADRQITALTQGAKLLNAVITYRRQGMRKLTVKETRSAYGSDPLSLEMCEPDNA